MERHHKMWPRRAYRISRVAWQFRNLPCNIVIITQEEHKEIHGQYRETPGGMPSRDEMLEQLNKCKDCKGRCVPHSQRIDHILEVIDDALGGDDEPQG